MAEKFRWGYEDIERNPAEALRLYRQAARLGRSDEYIRIGEFYEQGHVVDLDPTEAVKNYRKAFLAGNPYGHAAIAKLLARTKSSDRAEPHWTAVFTAIARGLHTEFLADDPGSSHPRVYRSPTSAWPTGEVPSGSSRSFVERSSAIMRWLLNLSCLRNSWSGWGLSRTG